MQLLTIPCRSTSSTKCRLKARRSHTCTLTAKQSTVEHWYRFKIRRLSSQPTQLWSSRHGTSLCACQETRQTKSLSANASSPAYQWTSRYRRTWSRLSQVTWLQERSARVRQLSPSLKWSRLLQKNSSPSNKLSLKPKHFCQNTTGASTTSWCCLQVSPQAAWRTRCSHSSRQLSLLEIKASLTLRSTSSLTHGVATSLRTETGRTSGSMKASLCILKETYSSDSKVRHFTAFSRH